MFATHRLKPLLCLSALLLLPASARAAETPLIDAGDPSNLNVLIENGADATTSTVDVAGQPFKKAARVVVNAPSKQNWDVQILSKKTDVPVAKGTVITGSFYIRAESVGGGAPEVPGFFRSAADGFEQLAWLGTKPTTAWKQQTFRVTTAKDYKAGDLAVNFHLGKVAQVVEIADLIVMSEAGGESTAPQAAAPPAADGKANPLDQDVVKQLGAGAKLILAGNRPAAFQGPGASPDASLKVVDVKGEPFDQAARVVVSKLTSPIWDAQLASPTNTEPVKKGDVLFGYLDIRAESDKESGGGQILAWLQAKDVKWEGLRQIDLNPGPQWSRRFFSLKAARDFPAGAIDLTLQLGTIAQTVDVANVLVWNLGPDANQDALPKTKLRYDGEEPDAPWRKEAARRIDEIRKGDLAVKVVGPDGKPLAGATVDVKLVKHAFEFATFLGGDSPALKDTPDGQQFRDHVLKYFNRVTCPIYAAQSWGWPNPEAREKYLAGIDWANAHDLIVSCHPVLWSRFDWSPAAWSELKDQPEALKAATMAHIDDVLPQLAAHGVTRVELLNEPVGFTQLDDAIGGDRDALRIAWWKHAREVAPSMRLAINEHTILSAGGLNKTKQDAYYRQIKALLDGGAEVGAIGMQGHVGEDFTSPTQIWKVLDRFADLGLPIYISEFDVNTEDEQVQADYTRDFITACFAHPAVEAVTLWGFWQPQMWIERAALWKGNWTPKPNGVALDKLLSETFHTEAKLKSDSTGGAKVRGFLGTYEVSVNGGPAQTVVLKKGGTRVTLKP